MKLAMAMLALVGVAGLDVRSQQEDPATRGTGWEVRVFVLDKATLKSADISTWTAQMDLEPRDGKEQKITLQRVTTGVEPKGDPKDLDKPKMHKAMVCGQVKDMDPYYVEMVVVPAGWTDKGATKDKPTGKEPGVAPDHEGANGDMEESVGYMHTHAGPYFKASLPKTWWAESKTPGSFAFEADVHFTYGSDKKSVKAFSYPHGLYKDVLQKVMDEDLKQAKDYWKAKDTAKLKEVGERIKAKFHALPELTFKKNEDREEFERARRECKVACDRLRAATSADEAEKVLDECVDKCDDYQDQSQDAEGVSWDFKGYDSKKMEPKPPAETPRK